MPGMTGGAPLAPGMSPADTATYGRAKERTGLATQSALKGLRETLANRGLLGSGIEANKTAEVFTGGLSNLAETDRQMAEQGAQREFTAREAGKNREFQAASEGLRAAMGSPETTMGSPEDPYGTKAAARTQAIFEAKQRIAALTGYSMPTGGASLY